MIRRVNLVFFMLSLAVIPTSCGVKAPPLAPEREPEEGGMAAPLEPSPSPSPSPVAKPKKKRTR